MTEPGRGTGTEHLAGAQPTTDGATLDAPAAGGDASAGTSTVRRSRQGPPRLLLILLGVALALSGAVAYVAVRNHNQPTPLAEIRASGLPNDVPASLANQMGLSPVPDRPAPNFSLVDQDGRTLSLRSFRGHAVVLAFMDTHCVDICPLVSQEFGDAYRGLGVARSHVVFIAVNVNRYHAAVADVAAFSTAHQLSSIPSWHFLTGSFPALQAVWRAYGIEVEAPSPTADIVHSSFLYFIDPAGRERYLANPTDDHTASGTAYLPAGQLSMWGRGIALVANSLSR
jgi:cytochrome oxidase Cu insertion factor (SCO1/SenC/PrrC family)